MQVESSRLDNNISVLTDYFNSVETVSIHVAVNVGSRDESISENGLSHFIEHMAFKGTEKRNAKEIAENFEAIGGHFNAFTSRDKTMFYTKCLKEDFETACELLGDIVLNSVFSEEEIERERHVILQELANSIDTPDDIIFDYYQELAYPEQSLGRTILGPKENLLKFDRNHIKGFFEKFYHANNMTISISGNIQHKKALDIVAKYFSKLKQDDKKTDTIPNYSGGEKHFDKDLEQTQIILGYKGIERSNENAYSLQIFNYILGEGMSSRLFQEIREKQGLCYTVYSFLCSYSDSGLFSIYTATDPKKASKAIELIEKEVNKTIHSISEEDIAKAVKTIKSSILMSMESTISRSRRVANSMINYDRFISNEEILEKLSKVTPSSIQDIVTQVTSTPKTLTTFGKVL